MIAKNWTRPHKICHRNAERGAAQRMPICLLITVFAGLAAGCSDRPQPQVVVYTSVDQKFAAEILERFERRFGVKVHSVFDTEAAKTTGLVRRLQRESTGWDTRTATMSGNPWTIWTRINSSTDTSTDWS